MINKTKWIIALLILSSAMVLVGALGKIEHWENVKPLMLSGMLLQAAVLGYALYLNFIKKQKA